MIDMATKYDDLTIAAVGPQTNLALVMEPELSQTLENIYVMSGAVFRPGNVRPTAEFNFYQDPESAARVTETGNTKLVALDVTEQTHVPFDAIERLAGEGEPHRQFANIIDYYTDRSIDRYGYEGPVVHDSVVAADLTDGILDHEDYCLKLVFRIRLLVENLSATGEAYSERNRTRPSQRTSTLSGISRSCSTACGR